MINIKSMKLPKMQLQNLAAAKEWIVSKRIWVALFAAMTLLATVGSVMMQVRAVTVFDGENQVQLRTLKQTVGDVLAKEGIVLNEKDEVSPALGMKLRREDSIVIQRAFDLTLMNGTEAVSIRTVGKPVSDVLIENSIVLGEMDVVSPALDTVVTPETQIHVTRVALDAVAEYVEIPYETVEKPNSQLDRGTRNVVQQGVAGQKEVVYNVVTQNGEQTAKDWVGERVVTEPVSEIVEYGTKSPMRSTETLSSRSGEHAARQASAGGFSYSRVITCNATAYDLSYESCGKHPGEPGYGVTASGMKAGPGVVAVDPRVIPLGTRLYIASTDGTADYGYAIAGDTGGAIKGNKIDLFFPSASQVRQFGRRNVTVYVLD